MNSAIHVPKIQRSLLESYEDRYGPSVKYYLINQGSWPPMAISSMKMKNYYFFTVGHEYPSDAANRHILMMTPTNIAVSNWRFPSAKNM